MGEDKQLEHQHDFDGIEELDNDLPRWWLGIFWVTMLVAVIYVPYYHIYRTDQLPEAKLAQEMADRAAFLAEQKADEPAPQDLEATLQTRFAAGGWQEAGKADYQTYCLPCHAADGGGVIGPNFTDDYYLHGGRLSDIQRVIVEGVPAKGMVPWAGVLKPEQIENLTFFIRAMRGTTPANPKEAQGKKVDEAGNFIEEEPAAI